MKKNIEWLKEEIEEDIKSWGGGNPDYFRGASDAYENVKDWLNQLDEPEVLSQGWIDKHSYNVHLLGTPDVETVAIPRDDLQNLLVPKQEEITEEQAWEIIHGKYGDEVLQNNIDYVESQGYVVIEKPTVPQFVADWHVQNKYYLLSAKFERIADWEDKRVVDWYRQCSGRHKNNRSNAQETIALMDLVGYEVEEEPKYYVLDKENATLLKKSAVGEGIAKSVGTNIYNTKSWKNEEEYQLTEQEIKDYDPRYMAFAVKVEELEE